uniref:Uncharacterized protein n=1 Tax=Glossina austeni TaxID=7395 RepID=A0A1A9UQY2_GLOAU
MKKKLTSVLSFHVDAMLPQTTGPIKAKELNYMNLGLGMEPQNPYTIELKISRIDFWRLVQLLLGCLLFQYASNLSHNSIFYYRTGTVFRACSSFMLIVGLTTSHLSEGGFLSSEFYQHFDRDNDENCDISVEESENEENALRSITSDTLFMATKTYWTQMTNIVANQLP